MPACASARVMATCADIYWVRILVSELGFSVLLFQEKRFGSILSDLTVIALQRDSDIAATHT